MPSLETVIEICFLFFFFPSLSNRKVFIQHTPLPRRSRPSSKHLSFGDGAADLGTALTGGETGRIFGDDVRSLLDNFVALGEDELDVARVGHVGVDLISLAGGNTPFDTYGVGDVHDREHGRCVCDPWGPG